MDTWYLAFFFVLFMGRIGIYVSLMNICSKQMSRVVKEVMRCNYMFLVY